MSSSHYEYESHSRGEYRDDEYDDYDDHDDHDDFRDHRSDVSTSIETKSGTWVSEIETHDEYSDRDFYREGNFKFAEEIYNFQIVNGVVLAEYDDDSRGVIKYPEPNETYVQDGDAIIKTEIKVAGKEITRYLPSSDGGYLKESSLWVSNGGVQGSSGVERHHEDAPDVYTFNVIDGVIVSIEEQDDHGSRHLSDLDTNETYTFVGTDVIKSELYPNGESLTRFVKTADGSYIKASKQWVPLAGAADSAVAPRLTSVFEFEGSELDDLLAVTTTQPSIGGAGADQFVVRELGHLVIEDFHRGEQDRIVFDTGLGLRSVDHLAEYLTDSRWEVDDLVLEFGSEISITLMGARINGISVENIEVLSLAKHGKSVTPDNSIQQPASLHC